MTFENIIKDYSWVTKVYRVAIWLGPAANALSAGFFVLMFTGAPIDTDLTNGFMWMDFSADADMNMMLTNGAVAGVAIALLLGFLMAQLTVAYLGTKWLRASKYTHAGFAGLVAALLPSIFGGLLQLVVLICAIILLVDPDKFVPKPELSDKSL